MSAFSQETIETRIFECIQQVNFRMIASVIESWELTEESIYDADGLRSFAIKTLGRCYKELIESDDHVVLFDAGRLRCEAYRTQEGEIHFSCSFVLSEGNSQMGVNEEEL